MIALGVENGLAGEESLRVALPLSPLRRHLGSSRALPAFDTRSKVGYLLVISLSFGIV